MALISQRAPSSSSSSSPSTTPWTFDVFLSFRGEDTRFGFVDHLHDAFKKRNFIVFKDDKKLKRGKSISEQLFKAIKQSQYAVVVISNTFAFSKWCLTELIEILKCKREAGLTVFPILYHVDPSDVQHQKGIFAKAFAKHREDPEVDEEQMKAWRAALKEVGEISRWHVNGSPESTVVVQITTRIFYGLRFNSLEIFKDLVGIKSRVEDLVSLLHLEREDVRFLMIHGMDGVGKTTLAKALCNIVRSEFDASCFIWCSNYYGSRSIDELQQQIIYETLGESNLKFWNSSYGMNVLRKGCNKKVFIILDDVNHDQFKKLAGNCDWFDKGSRIIVTARNCLFWPGIKSESYEVDPLESKDALALFCWKAFSKSDPENGFTQLSERVIRSVGCLPLALEVIGSLLCDKEIDGWMSVLKDLECLDDDIFSKLGISYNGLNESQKEMFLDIACFFCGVSKLEILPVFDSLGYNPTSNFEVLEKKSLIKISREGEIWMHNLLKEMGQRMVNAFSRMDRGNKIRLWCEQETIRVLEKNLGTDTIKGIIFNPLTHPLEEFSFEAFSKMRKLTVLILDDKKNRLAAHFLWSIKWVGDPSKLVLSNELRIMQWMKFPLESLPSSFQPDNLVKLSMPCSKIKVLWHGKRAFDRLKCIDLYHSEDLMEIPDLSGIPNLEQLDFGWCRRLREVHPSIGTLKKLLNLNLEHCKRLKRLPQKIYWKSLERLTLYGCTTLENFPENVSVMTSLRDLNFGTTGILTQSLRIGSHGIMNTSLIWLSSLSFLTSLGLSNLNLLDGEIPNDFSSLSSLQKLYLGGNRFVRLPKFPLSLCELEVENWGYYQREVRVPQLCNNVWFSATRTNTGYDGKPYKMLQLNRQCLLDKSTDYKFYEGGVFAWGPALVFEVPEWFNHRSTNRSHVDVDWKGLIVGFALFVAYQVLDHESSSCSIFGGSSPTFIWQFEAIDICQELPLLFRVPEVPFIGPNGFWAYIPVELFKKNGIDLDECHFLKTSIETSSLDVEVKDCGIRLVRKDDVSQVFKVLSSISPHGLELKNLKDLDFSVKAGVGHESESWASDDESESGGSDDESDSGGSDDEGESMDCKDGSA